MNQRNVNIIFALIVVCLIGTTFYFAFNKKVQPTINTNIEPATQQIDTTNWKKYKSSNVLSFEVKYPPDWSFQENKSPTTGYTNVIFSSPSQRGEDYNRSANISVEVFNQSGQYDKACAQPPDLYKEFISAHIFNLPYKLEGTNYSMQVLRFISNDRGGNISTCARFYVNSRDFFMEGTFPKEFDFDKLAPYFDEFIKSFVDKTY